MVQEPEYSDKFGEEQLNTFIWEPPLEFLEGCNLDFLFLFFLILSKSSSSPVAGCACSEPMWKHTETMAMNVSLILLLLIFSFKKTHIRAFFSRDKSLTPDEIVNWLPAQGGGNGTNN